MRGIPQNILKPVDEISLEVISNKLFKAEIELLSSIEFDLEIESPLTYFEHFKSQYKELTLSKPQLRELLP